MWSFLAISIGLYMYISAQKRSESLPYKLMHARASVMWKDENAHMFLATSGLLVSSYSLIWGLGYLEILGEWYIDSIAKPLYAALFTLFAAITIHSVTSLSIGASPLRMLRDSRVEGEVARQKIVNSLNNSPMHFSALRAELKMGKGQLRRHLDILMNSGSVLETEVMNRKEYSIVEGVSDER